MKGTGTATFPVRALAPIIVFFGLSGLVYLAYTVRLHELSSVLLLIPLAVWLARRKPQKVTSELESGSTRPLRVAIIVTIALYLTVMIVRTPAVSLLNFPIEKAPLIYLVVLWTVYVERRRVADYGFRLGRVANQALFGIFLYVGSQLVPFIIGILLLVILYRFNPVRSVDAVGFLASLPFQVFAVGVSEEGFFRGYMQTNIVEATGNVRRAVLYQSVLFGVWHFVWHINPLDFTGMFFHIVEAFVFGVFAGAFYRHTRTIAGLTLFHGLTNSVQLNVLLDYNGIPDLAVVLSIIVSGALTVAFGAIMILFSKRISQSFRVCGPEDDV